MKTNQVIAWHAPTPEMAGAEPSYQQLAQVWKRSWVANGWTSAIVGMQHANRHPFGRLIQQKVRLFPTHNGHNYETGCWVRWAAAANVAKMINKPVVMADTDVINYALKPEALDGLQGDVHVLDRFGVPCLVYLTPAGAEWLTEQIMAMSLPPDRSHYSDMLFFIEELVGKKNPKVTHGPWLCYAYGDTNFPDWEKAPTIHFAAGACRGQGPKKLNTVLGHVQNGIQAR